MAIIPRPLPRSPWIQVCAGSTAFTAGAFLVFEASWTASARTARMVGFAAAVVAGIAAHVWCRRRNTRPNALDHSHDDAMRVAIGTLLVGAISFFVRLETTELFAAPLLSLALGWGLLVALVLVDRRRVAWVEAIRSGSLTDVRIVDRDLEAPDFFAGEESGATVVRAATDAFRGEETTIARIPSNARTPDLVLRRRALALILAVPCAAVVVLTLTSMPTLGLPAELAPLTGSAIEIRYVGKYPFLRTEPELAFWSVNGADGGYRVVGVERKNGKKRLLQGRALFLDGNCAAPPRREDPPSDSTCARWASDVLTGKMLILSGTNLEATKLTFDGVTYPGTTRYCYALDVELGDLEARPCPPKP